jgi:hypothetical protein
VFDSRLTDGGKGVSLTRRPRFTPRNIFWYSFLLEADGTQGRVTAECEADGTQGRVTAECMYRSKRHDPSTVPSFDALLRNSLYGST